LTTHGQRDDGVRERQQTNLHGDLLGRVRDAVELRARNLGATAEQRGLRQKVGDRDGLDPAARCRYASRKNFR
jgi:hypothetical protein